MKKLAIPFVVGLMITLGACESPQEEAAEDQAEMQEDTAQDYGTEMDTEEMVDEGEDTQEVLADAQSTLQDMKSDAELAQQLQQAKAVFVAPHFGQGAFVVGGEGGEGVLLTQQNGTWGNPAFYNVGGITVGPQIGGAGGEVALLLMTDAAVQSFQQDNNFSLDANADLTLIDWSARGQASADKGDVIFWSGLDGAFAGVSLGVSDISWDDEANQAYYGSAVTPDQVMSGQAQPQQGAGTTPPTT